MEVFSTESHGDTLLGDNHQAKAKSLALYKLGGNSLSTYVS